MWIKYVGHPDGADVPLPGQYGELYCPYDTPVNVDAGLAKRLLEQPTNWRAAAAPGKDEKDEKSAKGAGKENAG